MSISIPKTNRKSSASFAALEKAYGILPSSYKTFLNQHDGATPEENIFEIDGQRNAGVEQFIPSVDIIHISNLVDGFPKHMLPFAKAAGGNLIYLNPADGNIYFWDHEVDSGDVKVADSFDQFLRKLKKFDIKQIKLKPGQLKRARVNPDFKPDF